jgi:HSP20 family protein
MGLIRWDPYRDMVSLREAMDRLFEDSVVRSGLMPRDRDGLMSLALDVVETDDDLVVKATLPGIKAEDVDITIDNGMLTIQGEAQEEHTEEGERYHLHERRYGAFCRSVALPVGVDADNAKAQFEDGVLTLTLPKSEEAKPKRIAVNSK